MRLTKKELSLILRNLGIDVPVDVEKQLLAEYGNLATDDEGHLFEYTEQDICEQLRKRLRPYMRGGEGDAP